MLVFRRLYPMLSIVLQLIAIAFISVSYVSQDVAVVAQDTGFELPVQLIGFPVIVMAVRTSNFVRKLAYALSPSTYRRSIRTTRGTDSERPLDYAKADQLLMQYLGPSYCVYEDVCLSHVKSARSKTNIDWTSIINKYSQLPANKQQYYLISVFLGDIIGSKKLCQHFNNTGRICH